MSTYRKVNMKEPPDVFVNCPDFLDCYLKYLSDFEHKQPSTVVETFSNLREMLQYFHFISRFHNKPSASDAHKELDISVMPISELLSISSGGLASYLDFLEFTVGNAPSTVNKKLYTFRSFFSYLERSAIELGLPDSYRSPTNGIRLRKASTAKSKILSSSKIQPLLDGCSGETELRDRAIIILLTTIPLQISDLIRLNRKDFARGRLCVRFQNKPLREIPLTDACSDAIEDYLSWLDEKLADDGISQEPSALFVAKHGSRYNRITPRAIQFRISKAASAAGLDSEEVTASKLRDAAVFNLIRSVEQNNGDRDQILLLLNYLGFDDPEQKAIRFAKKTADPGSAEELFRTAVGNSALTDTG